MLLASRPRATRIRPIPPGRVVVSARGAVLDLDSDLSTLLVPLRSQVATTGFVSGAPLVGIIWRWSSTVLCVLGAHIPDPLAITLLGWPGAQDRFDFNLELGWRAFRSLMHESSRGPSRTSASARVRGDQYRTPKPGRNQARPRPTRRPKPPACAVAASWRRGRAPLAGPPPALALAVER